MLSNNDLLLFAICYIANAFMSWCYEYHFLFTGITARIGFLKADDSQSDTWLSLSTDGELAFEGGGLITPDRQRFSISDAYNQTEVDWVHIAVSCNMLSARCYFYRNGSFIGESVEDFDREWYIGRNLFVGEKVNV